MGNRKRVFGPIVEWLEDYDPEAFFIITDSLRVQQADPIVLDAFQRDASKYLSGVTKPITEEQTYD
jgi:hypothetical protein